MKSRKTTRSATLNNRLAAYSATATAALLAAPAATAAIQDITELSINGGSFSTTAPSDFHGAGNGFFVVNFKGANQTGLVGFSGNLSLAKANNTQLADMRNHGGLLVNGQVSVNDLTPGAAIAGNFSGNTELPLARVTRASSSGYGPFFPGGRNQHKTGYIGFKTDLRGKTYYGWLHVRVQEGNRAVSMDSISLVANSQGDYGAFDLASDVSADNFKAGAVAAVPEPSSITLVGLGLLALGAAGVREHRRRKGLAAKN